MADRVIAYLLTTTVATLVAGALAWLVSRAVPAPWATVWYTVIALTWVKWVLDAWRRAARPTGEEPGP